MSEKLVVMCAHCTDKVLFDKEVEHHEYSSSMGHNFLGCPHLSFVMQESAKLSKGEEKV